MGRPDFVEVGRWLGQSAEPLDPAAMQFRAAPALIWLSRNDPKIERACNGCMFKGQKSKVCVQAGDLARRAGMPDCEERDTVSDKTHIYVKVEIDPRQLDITKDA